MELKLELLGGLKLTLGDKPLVGLRYAKTQALLCYLAVTGRPHSREALASLLWSESAEEDARTNLRSVLSKLRRALPNYLLITRESLAFNRESPYSLDVEHFLANLRGGEPQSWREAVTLYRGDFLEGFHVHDAPLFEEWLSAQRESLQERFLEALHKLAIDHGKEEEYSTASHDLRRLLALEPWREEAHRQLMLLLALSGQREAALSQYLTCCRILASELGLEPTSETSELYEKIRGREIGSFATIPATPLRPLAERRQLTVMSCELMGVGALAESLDPEDLQEVQRAYQARFREAIEGFGGYLAEGRGAEMTAYFGYPLAHEDDPARAVRAGLVILQELAKLDTPQHVGVRLGVHTGLVVVNQGEKGEPEVIGLTPIAAKGLAASAEANTLLIGETTARLVRGFFAVRGLGAHTLQNLTKPLKVYRVLGASGARSRLEASPGLTPLIGREKELNVLLERWSEVKEGRGQVVLISGEPGIGKSRLLWAFQEKLSDEPHTWLAGYGSLYHQTSAFYPVNELLQSALGFEPEDTLETKLAKLKATLSTYGLLETAPLLAALLSLLPASLSPESQKEETLAALIGLLGAMARERPVVLVLEDLHWCDSSTLELLERLSAGLPHVSLVVLVTFRSEFKPPWEPLTWIALDRLSEEETDAMIGHLTGKALPEELRRRLVSMTDGIPLFVEESTLMVLESGWLTELAERYELNTRLPPLAIPATLQDLLSARLDKLSAAKEIAQSAAVIGRAFSFELLRAVWTADEPVLQEGLASLLEAGLLYQQNTRFSFKHSLIQEATYGSLLRRKRQEVHARIAQILEERFPETGEAQPELLAYHYTEAGLTEQAVHYWLQAGQRAIQCGANVEAISHFSSALDLVSTLPDGPERNQRELDLLILLGPALMAIKGYDAPEVEHTYARARELCWRLGASRQRFAVLQGLAIFYSNLGDLPAAYELAEACVRLAEGEQDPKLLGEAHHTVAGLLFWMGEPAAAHSHLERAGALHHAGSSSFHHVLDLAVTHRCFLGWALWLLGYADQAQASMNEALTLAEERSQPFSLGMALLWSAMLHQFCREARASLERTERLLALSDEHGLAFWGVRAKLIKGWALTEQGQVAEGLILLEQGLGEFRATAKLALPYFLSLLAEAYRRDGQVEKGLGTLAEALERVEKTGERWWEAELHRLKGDLLLSMDRQQEAEASFCRGIAVAREQETKTLELRATVSLVRLWQKQDRGAQAHQQLAQINRWFTEGFAALDLRQASVLLQAW
jgi:DNA-binding SARP family transcriptional activator/predicted ATPase